MQKNQLKTIEIVVSLVVVVVNLKNNFRSKINSQKEII
jgi:ABC-type phosphate transport system substrate-binding protein